MHADSRPNVIPTPDTFRILALAPNTWHGPWMNRQQLLSRVARTHRVFYSTGPLSVWDRHGRVWQDTSVFPAVDTHDGVSVETPGRFPPRWPRLPGWDRFAIRHAAKRWQKRLDNLEGGSRVVYVFHPKFYPYVRHLEFESLIYHAYDLYRATPGWNAELESWEHQLLVDADTVIASSNFVAEEFRKHRGENVHFLPNGVDFETFSLEYTSLPPDLQAVPEPRIGYIGRINRKVDLPLIVELAQSNPDLNFVLIGPFVNLDDTTREAAGRLKELSNVHCLGEKTRAELPRYLAGLDVGLLCYRTGSDVWTKGIYPLKLHEYLARGLPIVSADVPSVREFADTVRIVDGAEGWNEALQWALGGHPAGERERRQDIARNNSWEIRSAELQRLIHQSLHATR